MNPSVVATRPVAITRVLWTLAFLFLSVSAYPQPSQRLQRYVPEVVSKLKPVGPLAESTPVDLVLGLPLKDAEGLSRLIQDLYDPASPRFHQYLTPGEFTEKFSPSDADFRKLTEFAEANKLAVIVASSNRKYLHVRAPAGVINKVFHVTLMQYQHPTDNRLFYAPDVEPTINSELPISRITGLDDYQLPGRFPNRFSQAGAAPEPSHAGGSGAGGAYTGYDFRKAYAPGVALTGRGQTVGVLELGNGYVQSDVATYEQTNGLPNVPIQNAYLNGYSGNNPNSESAADIELVISMAPGLSKVVVYGASYNAAGVHDSLSEMANPTKGEPLPYQITTSYYFFYDQNVYDALHQLAAQGQALFVASGDFGSYNETTGSGAFPPADHILVTSVGGTVLQTSSPAGAWSSESAISFSGGGHSPWAPSPEFSIPPWQVGIDYTLSQGSTTARNAPDVAMVADNILIYQGGQWGGFAGTSAAAPLWAGFMALVNEQAAASGRARVGFANPALYEVGRSGTGAVSFHDITTGNNFNAINPAKYRAVVGYDLCTGWGSPNGASLIDALVNYGQGWGEVPGGGTTNLPDAATTFRDRIQLFAVGIKDRGHYTNSFDGKNWSGWSAIPGGGTTNLAQTATVFRDRLYLFAIGINDHRHYVNSFDGKTWAGWQAVPGGGTTKLADATTVFRDRLYLFAVGGDDHRHYVNSFDGKTWAGWQTVPGNGTTELTDATTVFRDRLYLFAVGTNDHRHYSNSFDGTNWSGWTMLPGGGTTKLSVAATVFQDRLYLFGVGINDDHHYLNTFDGLNWAGWQAVPGGGTTKLADAVTVFQDKIHLFAIGINDHRHYMKVLP